MIDIDFYFTIHRTNKSNTVTLNMDGKYEILF